MVNCWNRPEPPRSPEPPTPPPATQTLPSSSADAPITLSDGSPSAAKRHPAPFGTMMTSPARQEPPSVPASVPPSGPASPPPSGPASGPASPPPSGPASASASSGGNAPLDEPLPLPQATAAPIAATAANAARDQRIDQFPL